MNYDTVDELIARICNSVNKALHSKRMEKTTNTVYIVYLFTLPIRQTNKNINKAQIKRAVVNEN